MEVFADIDTLSKAAADLFVELCAEAIATRGRFNVALSGGSTPKRMFEDLATGLRSMPSNPSNEVPQHPHLFPPRERGSTKWRVSPEERGRTGRGGD